MVPCIHRRIFGGCETGKGDGCGFLESVLQSSTPFFHTILITSEAYSFKVGKFGSIPGQGGATETRVKVGSNQGGSFDGGYVSYPLNEEHDTSVVDVFPNCRDFSVPMRLVQVWVEQANFICFPLNQLWYCRGESSRIGGVVSSMFSSSGILPTVASLIGQLVCCEGCCYGLCYDFVEFLSLVCGKTCVWPWFCSSSFLMCHFLNLVFDLHSDVVTG